MAKKGEASNPAAIIARGTTLGYTNIRATRTGGVEWIEPPGHDTNDAWEELVRRNLDAVVKYLRAEAKREKRARATEEAKERAAAPDDLARLRALWREMGEVLDRLERKS